MNSKALLTSLILALCLGALSACGDDDKDENKGEGTVQVTVWGEDYIEQGIPAGEMDDGWSVEFDKFIVTVSDVEVGGVAIATPEPLDIANDSGGQGHALGSGKVPAGTHDAPSFAVKKINLVGSATKGDVTKTFDWTFEQPTHYADCDTTTVVPADGEATLQITLHADHLFGDSLVSHDPAVVFQALADADADADGKITRAELEAADIGAYDPGNDSGIDNLWKFLVAQSQSLGHVDGEGHCHAHPATH